MFSPTGQFALIDVRPLEASAGRRAWLVVDQAGNVYEPDGLRRRAGGWSIHEWVDDTSILVSHVCPRDDCGYVFEIALLNPLTGDLEYLAGGDSR